MEKVRTSLRRCVCIVLCLLLFAAVLPVCAFSDDAQTKTVRAGGDEDAYNITGEHGERSAFNPLLIRCLTDTAEELKSELQNDFHGSFAKNRTEP